MASNLSSLGFDVPDAAAMRELVMLAATEGEPFDVAVGRYVRWSPGAGAELWVQIDRSGAIIGFNPHLAGSPGFRVRIESWVDRPGANDLDGAATGWAIERPDADGQVGNAEGLYPFVFDSPDLRRFRGLQLPAEVDLQVAAVARELTVFTDEAALAASGSMFASRSFIPSGMFRPGGETIDPPDAYAIFTGHVLTAEERMNPQGGPFRVLRVSTLGGEMDVAADPEILTTIPTPGSIVTGSFWLSGRIAGNPPPARRETTVEPEPARRPSLLDRLRGRS